MKLINGEYQFSSGILAKDLCEKYDCPVYIYDHEIIKRQYTRLSKAFEGISLQINYACKALTNLNILRLVKNLGGHLDAVSIQEVKLGLMAGFPHECRQLVRSIRHRAGIPKGD